MQQREENAETIANIQAGERMQSQHRGDCRGEKGNDLQYVPREANQAYGCKRDYNLRNRSQNKPGSTSGDELREAMESFRNQIIENTNNKLRRLEESLDRFKKN